MVSSTLDIVSSFLYLWFGCQRFFTSPAFTCLVWAWSGRVAADVVRGEGHLGLSPGVGGGLWRLPVDRRGPAGGCFLVSRVSFLCGGVAVVDRGCHHGVDRGPHPGRDRQ